MKRILGMWVAVCCLLLGAGSARATDLTDGAVIQIGSAQMTHEDISGWSVTGLSKGTISYNETTHTLRLDNASITKGLYIDAYYVDGEMTIQIIGECYFTVSLGTALHYARGDGLIIEGDKDAYVYIQTLDAAKAGAILCALNDNYGTLSEAQTYPLTIQGGLELIASNYYADGTAFTVYCRKTTIDHSKVTAYNKPDSKKPSFMTYNYWSDNEFNGVQVWYYNDYYEQTFFIPYTISYPIEIDGEQLNDAVTTVDKNMLQTIKSGSITYDPEKRILTLKDLEMEIPHEGHAIYLKDDASGQPITIVVDNPTNATKLTSKTNNPYSTVLEISTKAILDLHGCNLELTATYGRGIELNNGADLTICNSLHPSLPANVAEKATLKVVANSANGLGIYDDTKDSHLTIDHAIVSTKGVAGSLMVATTEKGSELDPFHKWNTEQDQVLDLSDNLATNVVEFRLTEWQLIGKVTPEGKGTVSFKESGSPIENPHIFSSDKTVEMTVNASDGWKFIMWDDGMGSEKYKNPRSVAISVTTGSEDHIAWLGKIPASQTEWIALYYDDINYKYELIKYENGFADLNVTLAEVPYTSGSNILCSDYADGYFYYIETPALGDKITMWKASFDGTTLGTPEKVIDNGTAYIAFDELSYSPAQNCFYAACIESSSYSSQLVKIALDGTITDVAPLPFGCTINAMTIAQDGTIYATIMEMGDEKWGTITPGVGMMTIDYIGDMSTMPINITGSNYTSMCYDNVSKELFLFDSDMAWMLGTTEKSITPVEIKNCKIVSVFNTVPPEAKLLAKPVEAGSGNFRLEAGSDSFDNEGTFEPDTKVTVTAIPESDFVFGYWLDDPNWKDADLRMGAEREITLKGGTTELKALFYYQPLSTATWYGVSSAVNRFVSFEPSEFAYKVTKASKPNGTNVKAGDFIEDYWCYVDGTTVRLLPFDGDFEDGADLTEDKEIEKMAESAPSGLTDIAYAVVGGEVYAIAGSELYQVNRDEKKLDKIGTLKYKGTTVTGVGIAIHTSGTLYILAQGATPGDEGVLYSVEEIDEDGKKVVLALVGPEEDGGKVGIPVTGDPQSIAFDHVTGEIFWGAPDYLRVFNLDNAKAHIAGDLGQTGGSQGTIKSLHKMDKAIVVKVQVAEGQEDMGSVAIGSGTRTKTTVIAGTKVTINATPQEGYEFDYWTKKQGSKESDLKDSEREQTKLSLTVSSATTFIAHFVKKSQGVETINDERLTIKEIRDGKLVIIRDGKTYNVLGVRL